MESTKEPFKLKVGCLKDLECILAKIIIWRLVFGKMANFKANLSYFFPTAAFVLVLFRKIELSNSIFFKIKMVKFFTLLLKIVRSPFSYLRIT